MPMYDYICPSCGHAVKDELVKTSDEVVRCPKCNSEMKKQFGNVTPVFTGDGFYSTDYKEKQK